MQTYTSKTTSVNTTKLPLVYNKINWKALKSVNPCVEYLILAVEEKLLILNNFY